MALGFQLDCKSDLLLRSEFNSGIKRNKKCNCFVMNILSFFQYNDMTSRSELVSMVAQSNMSMVKNQMKLEHIENIRTVDRHGNNLLHLSIIFKKMDIFNLLLNLYCVNVNVTNHFGQTCLHLAVINESEAMIRALLKTGADVNQSDEVHCTPLHVASSLSTSRMCRLLLDNGANIHAQNVLGRSALYHACQFGTIETASMLLCYGAVGADVDEFGFLPLTASMLRPPEETSDDFLEILFNHTFGEGRVDVSLMVLMTAMKVDSPLFPRMLEGVGEVKYVKKDLIKLSKSAILVRSDYFEMFMRRHSQIVKEMLKYTNDLYHELTVCADGDSMVLKFMEFLTMLFRFESSFNFLITSDSFDPIPTLVFLYKNKKFTMETLTQIVCFLYSNGMECRFHHVLAIYDTCGWCELFRYLLYMDVGVIYGQPLSLMPYLICDVRITLDKLMACASEPRREYRDVLRFFASQRLHDFFATDTEIYERVQRLSHVPSLTELARNETRKYIMSRYRVRKTREFYDVIKRLPINEIYKNILIYQRALYDF